MTKAAIRSEVRNGGSTRRFCSANRIDDDAELTRRPLDRRPPVENWDKMQGFLSPSEPCPTLILFVRRQSPIDAQDTLPMSRMALSTVT